MAAVVHPSCVLGRLFGCSPFVEHVPLSLVELLIHLRGGRVHCEFQSMTARIKEVNRLEDRVVGRAQDLDAVGFEPSLGLQHFFQGLYFQRQVLSPYGRVDIPPHGGLGWQLKKRQNIAAPCIEENMHVRIGFLGGGHFVLSNCKNEVHVEVLLIPLNRLLGVLAAIGYVVDLLDFDG